MGLVCELKESENHLSTSFKKLWVGGGWVHCDYNVSSAPFVSELRLWEWNLEIWAEMSRSRAWQLGKVILTWRYGHTFGSKYRPRMCKMRNLLILAALKSCWWWWWCTEILTSALVLWLLFLWIENLDIDLNKIFSDLMLTLFCQWLDQDPNEDQDHNRTRTGIGPGPELDNFLLVRVGVVGRYLTIASSLHFIFEATAWYLIYWF